jgi:hypothetical protein
MSQASGVYKRAAHPKTHLKSCKTTFEISTQADGFERVSAEERLLLSTVPVPSMLESWRSRSSFGKGHLFEKKLERCLRNTKLHIQHVASAHLGKST